MSVTSYIFGIASALLTLIVVIEMLRRRRLRERHAVWWVIGGALALVIGIFPSVLAWAATLLGFDLPANLVFFVSIAVLFLVCIQHSVELTALESHARALAEASALQEIRLQQIELRLAQKEITPTVSSSGLRKSD